ncbi:MAG: hypothetical protein PVI40_04830 [Chlamydiota bacterium]
MTVGKMFDAIEVVSMSGFLGGMLYFKTPENMNKKHELYMIKLAIAYVASSVLSYPFRSYDNSDLGKTDEVISSIQVISIVLGFLTPKERTIAKVCKQACVLAFLGSSLASCSFRVNSFFKLL